MTTKFQLIAWKVGFLLALCGVIWSCIQICFGTMEVRKFAVGIITKWFFFVVCISMLPAFSKGLFSFASQAGDEASGASRDELSADLSEYYNSLKKLVSKKAEEYEDAIKDLKDAKKKMGNSVTNVRKKIHQQEKIEEKESDYAEWKKENRVWKIINSLEDVLIIDGSNVTDSYELDLSLKTTNALGDTEDLKIMSPAAYYKIAVLCCEIMWDREWTDSVKRAWAENSKVDTSEDDWEENFDNKNKILKIMDFPASKIFEIALCGLVELVLLAVSCVQLVQYLMCVIEYSVTSTVCLVLVPCMLFDGTKDMANKILPTLFAQAMKMCMIVICMYFSLWIYMTMLSDIMFTGGFSIRVAAYVIFLVILSFALVSNAPKIAATIMTGSPQMSMGEFVQAAGALAGGFMKGTALAAGGAKMAAGVAGGAVSFAGNRAGDLAEAAGAGINAANQRPIGSGGSAALDFASGFAGNLLSQTGGRLRSAGGNFLSKGTLNPVKAWHGAGGGGSSSGGAGGGGAGFNRFNQAAKNSDGSRDYGKDDKRNPLGANSPGADHSSDRKYGNAYNSNGEKTTYGEWLGARFRAGFNSKPMSDEHIVKANSSGGGGNSPNPPSTGLALRGNGGPVAPSGGGGDVGFFGGGFPDLKFGSSFSPAAALPDNRLQDAKKEIHNTRWGDKNSAEDAELT